MPALDEEDSVGTVIDRLLNRGVAHVIVADNGSRDSTAAVAQAAGATVVHEARRGYGSACQAALATVPPWATAVLFCDADGADDLDRLDAIVDPVLARTADLVIGCRRTTTGAALSLPQRVGNLVAALLMRVLYRRRVHDLGPFRCVACAALPRLAMRDPAYGWTAEMQVKAYRLGLRVREVPVRALPRLAGTSKISGRLGPVFKAGAAIIATILRYHAVALDRTDG